MCDFNSKPLSLQSQSLSLSLIVCMCVSVDLRACAINNPVARDTTRLVHPRT